AILVGDAIRLRQAMLNLVGNAIKFTEKGDVRVEVSLAPEQAGATPIHNGQSQGERNRSEDEVLVRFSVSDTGIGIPPEKLQSIFEPFVQADSSLSRKYGGTGLGLSISARLVEMMGGRIEVVSEPDRGSTFTFTIPLGTTPLEGLSDHETSKPA